MGIRKIWLLVLGACLSCFAQDRHTRKIDFSSGGVLRMKHSTGSLTIEAWDQPAVELTTSQSAKNPVVLTMDRHGNELVISTTNVRHFRYVDLATHLWVPRDTRLFIDHRDGEVNIEGIAAQIDADLRSGNIFLYLPNAVQYSLNAKCDFGTVDSDTPNTGKRHSLDLGLGHRVTQETEAKSYPLNLKVRFGDIFIVHETPRPKAAD